MAHRHRSRAEHRQGPGDKRRRRTRGPAHGVHEVARQGERLATGGDGAQTDQVHPGNAAVTSFEETLVEVWRQAFAENSKAVVLGDERYPVVRKAKRRLRQVDFQFEGKDIRGGLEGLPKNFSSMVWVPSFHRRHHGRTLGFFMMEQKAGWIEVPSSGARSSATDFRRSLW
jgi:hypothetical protein